MTLQVYNLPETVRESDVEKLSFAVQLAEGFYADSQVQPALPVRVHMTCSLSLLKKISFTCFWLFPCSTCSRMPVQCPL